MIEQRAVAAVIADEAAAGWHAVDMNTIERNHPGYDIRSEHRDNNNQMTAVRYIEVKGRIAGADTVTVSRNEILTSLNELDKWVLPSSKFTQDKAKKSATSTACSKHRTASIPPHKRQLQLEQPGHPATSQNPEEEGRGCVAARRHQRGSRARKSAKACHCRPSLWRAG